MNKLLDTPIEDAENAPIDIEKRVKELEDRMDDVVKEIKGLRGDLAAAFQKIFWGDENWSGMAAIQNNSDKTVELLKKLVEKDKESGED